MKLELLADWKNILKKAWSVRFVVFGGLCDGFVIALPYWSESIPRAPFTALAIAASIGALVSRVTPQKNMSNDPAK
jgi:hypothetical protein